MANQPPPIIRSTKPFSVEIPQGSNSAKARRSDIVANDELDITHKKSNFHDSTLEIASGAHNVRIDSLQEPSFLSDDDQANAGLHKEAKDAFATGDAAFDTGKDNDNLQQLHEDPDHSNHAQLPESDKSANAKGPIVKSDAFTDRFANEENGPANANNLAVEAGVNANENLQAVGNEQLKDNLQGLDTGNLKNNLQPISEENTYKNIQNIEQDTDHDNLQAVATDPVKDNRQAVEDSSIEDNNQDVFKENEQENLAAIDNETLKDITARQAKETLNDHSEEVANSALDKNQPSVPSDNAQDNLQGLPKENISDNLANIDQESLQDNNQSLEDEALSDNHQNKDAPVNPHNHQPLEDEALETRNASTNKEHLHDHIEALPDTSTSLKDGPKSVPTSASSSSNAQPIDALMNKSTTVAEEAAKRNTNQAQSAASAAAAARLEHAKRQGEFHGRVEALKKTVSGINHILDELDEKKTPYKP